MLISNIGKLKAQELSVRVQYVRHEEQCVFCNKQRIILLIDEQNTRFVNFQEGNYLFTESIDNNGIESKRSAAHAIGMDKVISKCQDCRFDEGLYVEDCFGCNTWKIGKCNSKNNGDKYGKHDIVKHTRVVVNDLKIDRNEAEEIILACKQFELKIKQDFKESEKKKIEDLYKLKDLVARKKKTRDSVQIAYKINEENFRNRIVEKINQFEILLNSTPGEYVEFIELYSMFQNLKDTFSVYNDRYDFGRNNNGTVYQFNWYVIERIAFTALINGNFEIVEKLMQDCEQSRSNVGWMNSLDIDNYQRMEDNQFYDKYLMRPKEYKKFVDLLYIDFTGKNKQQIKVHILENIPFFRLTVKGFLPILLKGFTGVSISSLTHVGPPSSKKQLKQLIIKLENNENIKDYLKKNNTQILFNAIKKNI